VTLLVATSCGDDGDGTAAEAEDPPASWPTLGWALDNTRASTDESTLGPDTVADLAPLWEQPGLDGFSGTPIVDDGMLYGGDWAGNVWARDVETGDVVWEETIDGSRIQAAVAIDDERVYAGTFGARFAALDRESGDVVWDVPLDEDEHPFAASFGAPIHVETEAGPLVIVGVGSYENMIATADDATFRGSLVAFDPETGDEKWRYWTTTGDDEEGAGVGTWSTPAVDAERGLLYFGTGQHHAQPTSDRSDSVIALDVATGEEEWITQFTENDTWTLPDGGKDVDVGTPPSLFEVDGTDAVGAGDKDGTYKALDRESGDELWSKKLTDGSPQGGIMHSAAVADGSVFVASNQGGGNALLFSLDVDSGDEIWSVELGGSMMGPPTWANGVVYTADNSGTVSAFDAESSELLWSHEVESQSGSGIAVVDGTLYTGYGWWLVNPAEDQQGGLVAFGLAGTSEDSEDSDEVASGEIDAAEVFQQRCASCHSGDGSGGSGPDITDTDERLSADELTEVVTDGRGAMPSWEGTLSEEEIAAVVDYVRNELGD
jgi:polyvinyl alcohol dehydrogenase (cytochrome)